MSHEVVPCHRRPACARPESRSGHVSVAFGSNIYVWGGYHELQVARWTDERYLPSYIVWIFNTFTREWKKQNCSGQLPKVSSGSCALVHGHYMYLFAGFTETHANLNSLYKLDLKTFVWSRADGLPHNEDYSDSDDDDDAEKKRQAQPPPYVAEGSLPSRRDKLCGWVYGNKLYFFGGFGPSLDSDPSYLKEDGVWTPDHSANGSQMTRGWNNQVVAFDLDTLRWASVANRGPRPLPRAAMAATIIGHRVFIFGGRHDSTRRADMNCLDMKTLEWTGELIPPPESPRPSGRSWSALSVVDEHLLFLYGGYDQNSTPLNDGFLYHVDERRWTPLPDLPDLSRLPLTPTPAWMHQQAQQRPATTKGLFWHSAVTVTCPPTAAAAPGVYVFGGMLTPIGPTSNLTFHSAHLLHFAFGPKSLTLLALEHLAARIHQLVKNESEDEEEEEEPISDGGGDAVRPRLNSIMNFFEPYIPRPLPSMLRKRVDAMKNVVDLEKAAKKRPNQLGLPQHPTDGAGGYLMFAPMDDENFVGVVEDGDGSDDDSYSDESDDG